jgi:hypothetical protein
MKNNFSIPQPLPRIARFEELGFGLFLHFGLYSLLGKDAWIQDFEKIPVQEYEPLAERFTVEKFDLGVISRGLEAEHNDDDGVDREGIERGSSSDSVEGIVGSSCKKR